MITRRTLAVSGIFPIELWDDRAAREAAVWPSLRDKAAAIAASDGRQLATEIGRQTRFVKIVDGPGGEPQEVETTHDDAELVQVILRMWAQ